MCCASTALGNKQAVDPFLIYEEGGFMSDDKKEKNIAKKFYFLLERSLYFIFSFLRILHLIREFFSKSKGD